jgi:hypothetical protein
MRPLVDPLPFYRWDTGGGDGGTSESRTSALTALSRALRASPPGAQGSVRRVALGGWLTAVKVVELDVIVYARRDPDTGKILWHWNFGE